MVMPFPARLCSGSAHCLGWLWIDTVIDPALHEFVGNGFVKAQVVISNSAATQMSPDIAHSRLCAVLLAAHHGDCPHGAATALMAAMVGDSTMSVILKPAAPNRLCHWFAVRSLPLHKVCNTHKAETLLLQQLTAEVDC